MSTSQIALLVVFTVVIGGGMFYFIVQPNTMVHREAECVTAGRFTLGEYYHRYGHDCSYCWV